MHSDGFTTPVLMAIFNRPDTTKQVFDQVRAARPQKLFVAADAPRVDAPTDGELCENALSCVTEHIDWPCELKVLRRSKNLGCKLSMSTAISWFLDAVPAGIILEDDCVPSPSFFTFCEAMLARYQDDERIGHIGGFNCQHGRKRGSGSYYFSRLFHVWGWATWRRAWQGYDAAIPDYTEFLRDEVLEDLFDIAIIRRFWKHNFDTVFEGSLDTWDYQWVYKNFKEGRLAITPNTSLVRNIGFRGDATHTTNASLEMASIEAGDWEGDLPPTFVVPDRTADAFTYKSHLGLPISENGMSSPSDICAYPAGELWSALVSKGQGKARRIARGFFRG